MNRILVVLVALLLAAGCGGGEGDSGSAQHSDAPPSGSNTPGREAVPDIPPMADATAGVSLLPYLDEAGSVTEMALAANDVFTIHVLAEIDGHTHTSAAQFAMSVPPGISVIGEQKFSPRALTVGKYSDLFAIAYECHESGRFLLMKFTCRVDDTFKGGELTVRDGVDAEGTGFLGFATCGGGQAQQLPATGGAVTLTLK